MQAGLEVAVYVGVAALSAGLGWLLLNGSLGGWAAVLGGAVGGLTLALWAQHGRTEDERRDGRDG